MSTRQWSACVRVSGVFHVCFGHKHTNRMTAHMFWHMYKQPESGNLFIIHACVRTTLINQNFLSRLINIPLLRIMKYWLLDSVEEAACKNNLQDIFWKFDRQLNMTTSHLSIITQNLTLWKEPSGSPAEAPVSTNEKEQKKMMTRMTRNGTEHFQTAT